MPDYTARRSVVRCTILLGLGASEGVSERNLSQRGAVKDSDRINLGVSPTCLRSGISCLDILSFLFARQVRTIALVFQSPYDAMVRFGECARHQSLANSRTREHPRFGSVF